MRFVKPVWLNSLSFKVLIAYLIGVVLSITLVILVTFWVMVFKSHYFAVNDIVRIAEEQAGQLRFDDKGYPIDLDVDHDDLAWVFDSFRQEAAYRILDASGHTVLASAAGEKFWYPLPAGPRQPGPFEFQHNGTLIHAATALIRHEGKDWYLQFAVSARFHYFLHRYFALPFMGIAMLLLSTVLLFVFGVCAYITLRYTFKPLRQVSESAAAISPRSLHARLSAKGMPLEISPLVDSFNRVLDRLEQGYRIQQEFLATAAHELKTPLALIRAQIEVKGEGEDRDALLNDVAHMARQVQQLLLLAEVSEAQNYSLSRVDVAEVSAEVAHYLLPMAEAAGVRVSITHTLVVYWQADRAALFSLLKNLLENAIQHAPAASAVHIDIQPMVITVRDWGPGVSLEQLSHLFVRFWRGPHRRDHGAGLGLAICQEIAQAHGWTLTAHRANPGLCFKMVCAP